MLNNAYIVFGGIILVVVVGYFIMKLLWKYWEKQHTKFKNAFYLKFNKDIIETMKRITHIREVLDKYYNTHIKYATYETIDLYTSYMKDNVYNNTREKYYNIIDSENIKILNDFDIDSFFNSLCMAEIEIIKLKNSVVEQIESRFIKC